MAGMTKPERNRIHKVLERDRMRRQFQAEGFAVPPLMDPDVLGRGPGTGPTPVGADEGDEEAKPSAAQVARETRRAYAKRVRENVPAIELVPSGVGGEYRLLVRGEEAQAKAAAVPAVATSRAGDTTEDAKPAKPAPPKKAVLEAITDKKIAGREVNLRGEYDKEEQAEAVEAAKESAEPAAPEEVKRSRKQAATSTSGKRGGEVEAIKKGVSR